MIQKLELEINPQYAVLMRHDFPVLSTMVLMCITAHCLIHMLHTTRAYQQWMRLPEGHIISSTAAFTSGLFIGIIMMYVNLIFPLRQITRPWFGLAVRV